MLTFLQCKNLSALRSICGAFCGFLLLGYSVQAQEIDVSGKVTDDLNQPLPGVNIIIKGTSDGTITDTDGNYTISAPANATLVFSYIGYTQIEVAIGNRSVIDVSLAPDLATLDEVVVVGYGTQKKSDVTGSTVQISESALREVPAVTDASQAMKGRLPGVFIANTGADPGAPAQIRIRGSRSLGADNTGVNDPLIVLDGIPFPGNLNDISPGDIENINVLKDASATAIYGSRGANGVILITTKRGKSGKPTLRINTSYGFVSLLDTYDVFEGDELLELKRISGFGGDGSITEDELRSQAAGEETDWQRLISDVGHVSNNEIGISGGSENTQYNISLNFFDQTTTLPLVGFRRYSMRSNLDHEVGRLKFGLSIMNTLTIRKGDDINPYNLATQLSPYYRPYEDDGVTVNPDIAEGHINDTFWLNPLLLFENEASVRRTRNLRTFSSAYAEVRITDGLRYRLNVGLDYADEERGTFEAEGSFQAGRNGASNAEIRNSESWNYVIENLVLYNKDFGNHQIGFTGLFSVQEQQSHSNSFGAEKVFSNPVQYFNFNLAEAFTLGNENDWQFRESGIVSFMGRLNYTYQNRLSATVTIRSDGSSRLADENQWFTYPAAAVAWNLHNEDFMSGITGNTLSNLKLRVGWGRTSNQSISEFASLGSLESSVYNFGDEGVFGFFTNELPNAALEWEFTSSTNIGIDFGLFQNRVTGTLDYYNNQTDQVLQTRALPITSGVPGTFQENIGETEGKGIEIMLDAIIIEPQNQGDFSLGANVNFTRHRGEIKSLAGGVTQDIGNGWFVGHPVDVVYDFEKIGIWQLGEETEAIAMDGAVPGDIRVRDLDGDGVIDASLDRKVLGNLIPDWTSGFTIRAGYKGIDFSLVGFARVGGLINSQLFGGMSLEGRTNQVEVDYWTPDNPTNAFPRTGEQFPIHRNTLGYFSGTFMKIRSINIGYNLPQTLLDRLGMSSARVYFSAVTPFKAWFSDYVDAGGLDPESNQRIDNGDGDFSNDFGNGRLTVGARNPVTKQLIFGLNLIF